MPAPLRLRRDAGRAVLEDDPLAHGQHAVDHGDIEELPAPRSLRPPACRRDAEGQKHRRHDVADARPDLGRRPARRPAGDAHDAAHRLRDRIVGRPVRIGAFPAALVAEAAQRGIDEARIGLRQRLIGQPQPLHHAAAVIVDQHIGLRGEPAQHVLARRLLQIDDDRFLVPVDRGEIRPVAAFLRRQRAVQIRPDAACILTARRLDLDHARALVGQHHAGIGTGQHHGHVDHGEAVERAEGRLRRIGCSHAAGDSFSGEVSAREHKANASAVALPPRMPRRGPACPQPVILRIASRLAAKAALG